MKYSILMIFKKKGMENIFENVESQKHSFDVLTARDSI